MEDDDIPKQNKKQRQLERRQKQNQKKQEEIELAKKREVKLARKSKKQAKRRQSQEEQKKKYNAVPFDYTKAASVMHAARGQPQQNGPKEQKRVFDPYSKTGENEIKGARKMPPVRGERSATFKK
jgi:exosome complex exonuclease RRP6